VVKTLIEKKQPITQIRRPHYPILVIHPQVGNQCARQSDGGSHRKARGPVFLIVPGPYKLYFSHCSDPGKNTSRVQVVGSCE